MEEYLKEKVWALQRENYRLEEQVKDLKKQIGLLEQLLRENNEPVKTVKAKLHFKGKLELPPLEIEGEKPSVGDFNPTVRKVHERIDQQQLKGFQKYGTFVQADKFDDKYWLEHLAQELTDALVYIQVLLDRLEEGCSCKCQSNSKKEESALVVNVES